MQLRKPIRPSGKAEKLRLRRPDHSEAGRDDVHFLLPPWDVGVRRGAEIPPYRPEASSRTRPRQIPRTFTPRPVSTAPADKMERVGPTVISSLLPTQTPCRVSGNDKPTAC